VSVIDDEKIVGCWLFQFPVLAITVDAFQDESRRKRSLAVTLPSHRHNDAAHEQSFGTVDHTVFPILESFDFN